MYRGYARVFGTERIAFLLAFTLSGLNVLLVRSFLRMLKARARAHNRAEAASEAADGTFEQVLGRLPETADGWRSAAHRHDRLAPVQLTKT